MSSVYYVKAFGTTPVFRVYLDARSRPKMVQAGTGEAAFAAAGNLIIQGDTTTLNLLKTECGWSATIANPDPINDLTGLVNLVGTSNTNTIQSSRDTVLSAVNTSKTEILDAIEDTHPTE